ncbi:hypothetical protein HN018_21050 [Lichenicola cladoniae]|uniref:ASCH domain-containing protein n=1 Tax=Lichenicola cladoniae TaxID=1484109 RepID=A0A6M8HUH3_9PROT|nr:hypothetical protein [Lichenicola cladoniae]NPD69433.1 hypothetical protein [Acetobacteraceae bacterium]QKE92189.1 hypothetical protein HN018_21050 [Lichenicola cladoniae]
MRVLLSINPIHVENILKGIKTFEFRRRLFARRDITTVLIYSTMPVGRFVAEFDIADILEDDPERLWKFTQKGSGISKRFYDTYFAGRQKAFALQIGELRVFDKPINPLDVLVNFTPPQSYMYIGGRGEDIRRQQQLVLV